MKIFARQIGSFFENPEKADIILFTHDHADHCYPSSITKMVKPNTTIIGSEKCSKKIGKQLQIIKVGEVLYFGTIKIHGVDAYNIRRKRSSGNLWHPKGSGLGYLIKSQGKTVYHTGDTELIPEMQNLGSVDIILIPIDGKFTMDIDEAVEAIKLINPKEAIPIHEHEADPFEFKRKVEERLNTRVIVLEKGEIHKLS
jgi:L-ascorbate metabolism protein UlaG (beta-lactamase superfamily)